MKYKYSSFLSLLLVLAGCLQTREGAQQSHISTETTSIGTIATSIGTQTTTTASVPPVESLNICTDRVNKIFSSLPQPTIEKSEFEKKYKLEKKLEAGASGDSLSIVIDEAGHKRVLKMFSKSMDKQKYEMIITCRNSMVPFFPVFKNMDAKDPHAFGTFFPKFFDMGAVTEEREESVKQPDGSSKMEKKSGTSPFMVIELLSGHDLIDADSLLRGMDNKELLSIVYEIALAINTAFNYYGFKHYDLHPGNIRLLDERIDLTTKDGIRLNAPLVVIFDFGLARDKDYTARQEASFFDNETRSSTRVLSSFLDKFGLSTGGFFSSDGSVKDIAATKSSSQDVRFFNQIFAAIWTILKKNKFVDNDFPYCGPTMQDCLNMEIFSRLKH